MGKARTARPPKPTDEMLGLMKLAKHLATRELLYDKPSEDADIHHGARQLIERMDGTVTAEKLAEMDERFKELKAAIRIYRAAHRLASQGGSREAVKQWFRHAQGVSSKISVLNRNTQPIATEFYRVAGSGDYNVTTFFGAFEPKASKPPLAPSKESVAKHLAQLVKLKEMYPGIEIAQSGTDVSLIFVTEPINLFRATDKQTYSFGPYKVKLRLKPHAYELRIFLAESSPMFRQISGMSHPHITRASGAVCEGGFAAMFYQRDKGGRLIDLVGGIMELLNTVSGGDGRGGIHDYYTKDCWDVASLPCPVCGKVITENPHAANDYLLNKSVRCHPDCCEAYAYNRYTKRSMIEIDGTRHPIQLVETYKGRLYPPDTLVTAGPFGTYDWDNYHMAGMNVGEPMPQEELVKCCRCMSDCNPPIQPAKTMIETSPYDCYALPEGLVCGLCIPDWKEENPNAELGTIIRRWKAGLTAPAAVVAATPDNQPF